MFCSDFFKVLCPVLIEAELFLAESVKPRDQLLDTLLEPTFVGSVVVITRLDNLFMVISVAHIDLR